MITDRKQLAYVEKNHLNCISRCVFFKTTKK